MARIILDASFALACGLEEPGVTERALVLEKVYLQGGVVPKLFPYEVANTLVKLEQRNALPVPFNTLIAYFWNMNITVDASPDERVWTNVASLARRHSLTVYDASYLDLALREGGVIATLDADLKTAADAEGLWVLP